MALESLSISLQDLLECFRTLGWVGSYGAFWFDDNKEACRKVAAIAFLLRVCGDSDGFKRPELSLSGVYITAHESARAPPQKNVCGPRTRHKPLPAVQGFG